MCGSLSVAEDDSRLEAVPKGPMVFGHARLNAAPMSQWVKTRHLQCNQACLLYPQKRTSGVTRSPHLQEPAILQESPTRATSKS